jgi:hypothetical protein
MNRRNKHVLLLASALSVFIAATLVIGASAANPDPFKGVWHSVDTDGSNQTMRVGGGPGVSHHVVYYDDGASVCGFDADGNFLAAASAVGALGVTGDTLSGLMPVYCLASPRYLWDLDAYFELTYQPGSDTLLDIHGVTWSR